MSASIQITVPIFTKAGAPLDEGQLRTLDRMGLVHLGDAQIDVPVDFQQALPFEEIETALQGQPIVVGDGTHEHVLPPLPDSAYPPDAEDLPPVDKSTLEGPHSRACGVIPHLHGAQCHPNCPTCNLDTPASDGSGVTVPTGEVPAPDPT